ncbi:tRNA lysidine(34) synthetase TilS [Sphingomonas crusticola]|uniref:tRNA lysidine(34) synthetase TilS n=1 Tax=Sphingomonas crusticola TaxID=1697973 RepID=UPI000E2788F0|nr:tRNA lysidine(34) synthetase TilS [Sphingomonas crusticola]
MDAAPDDLIDRFRADYCRLLTAAEPPDHRIALAVSGGPDSMAMLGLAAPAFPGRVIAATVDHGLRRGSADEAAMVAQACAKIGVAHTTLRIAAPPGASGNLHDWARQERYLLLKRWAVDEGAPVLCTAHHADDQAETFLMRAARAAGLSGLAAVRARTEIEVPLKQPIESLAIRANGGFSLCYGPVVLLRPLLRWRRQELREAAEKLCLPFVDDPSNHDPRFDRTRFRAWLAEAPWLDPIQIGRSAENLAGMDADLFEISRWLWQERALEADPLEARFDVRGLPRGVKRYLARIGINHVLMMQGMSGGNWSQASNIEPLLDALEAGSAATQANVLASAKGTIWHFRAAPRRRSH